MLSHFRNWDHALLFMGKNFLYLTSQPKVYYQGGGGGKGGEMTQTLHARMNKRKKIKVYYPRK
jgi:hypothetical protein